MGRNSRDNVADDGRPNGDACHEREHSTQDLLGAHRWFGALIRAEVARRWWRPTSRVASAGMARVPVSA